MATLDSTKAPGIDYVNPYLLKLSACPLLAVITSFRNCALLNEWKILKIIPIPKAGSYSDVKNRDQ